MVKKKTKFLFTIFFFFNCCGRLPTDPTNLIYVNQLKITSRLRYLTIMLTKINKFNSVNIV
jgi:hypothetical protein